MTTRVTDRDDPAIETIVADGALVEPFNRAKADLVVIGEEEGVPVGLVSGLVFGGFPLLLQIGIRPGFRGERRTRALVDAFAAAWAERGFDRVTVAIDHAAPWAEWIERLLHLWPATRYWQAGSWSWWVHFPERVTVNG